MRYLIRRHLLLLTSAPSISPPHLIAILLPAPLPAEPCRQTGRLETRRHPVRYSPRLPALSACHHLTHRPISSAHLIGSSVPHVACLPRQTHAVVHRSVHPSHPSHRVYLPSRPASRSASRRASRLAYLPASFHFIGLSLCPLLANAPTYAAHPSHFVSSAHRLHLITHANRIRRATSRRNGAHDGQSTTGKKERHDIRQLTDTANTPPRPPYSPYSPYDARTPTRIRKRENAPFKPLTTPLTGRRAGRRDDKRDAHASPACLPTRRRDVPPPPASRHDDGTQNDTANYYPPHGTKNGTTSGTRETGSEAGRTTGRESGTKKTGRSYEKKGGPKTGRDIRLNEKNATLHRYWNPPANEGNQANENDNTHTAHASSQSPQGYHRSTKS